MARQFLNPDKATAAQMAGLYNANQRAGQAQVTNYAEQAAAEVRGLGAAAAAGGKFIDTSAAPGFQSPVTGQYTAMLGRSITTPAMQQNKALEDLIALRKNKKYQNQVAASAKAGTGSYAGAMAASGLIPAGAQLIGA